ncbi:hypothetical protein UT300007_31760 [Clostridium sp. CTA-7]
MKRKMIIARLTALALTTALASSLTIQTASAYAYSITANSNEENLSIQSRANDYNTIGGVKSFDKLGNKVTFEMTTGEKVRVSFLESDIFRLYMDPEGKFQEDPTPNSKDHITKIIDKAEDEYSKITPTVENGDIIRVSTDSIELKVEKETGKMELFNKKTNKTIWKEAEPLKYKTNETVQTLETTDDEYFYGGGQQNGRFSHKGKTINIKNENNWVDGGVSSPTPFYWSTNGYGVMRHTFKPGQYAFSSTEKGKVITKHDEKRFDAYYFIDDTPSKIINKFTDLTGKPVLLPEYAFYIGHANAYARDWINDETGQESQTQKPGFDRQETLMVDAKKVVDEHVDNDMPIGWFLPNDGYGAGYGRANTIDGNIALLKEFVDYTRSKGIQTGLWTQSDLKPTGVGEVYLQRDIDKEVGVAGTNAVKTDVAWVGAGYSFALNAVRQAAEGIVNNSKDRARPFIISLDGWAGTQRYAGIWSGDQTGGNWEYIRFHIPTYIGSGLSGQPNVGSDIDGIFGGDSLIQTRDIQWKAFTPIEIDMDGWGKYPKKPYQFGEPTTSINRMYLKLKAEMMAYNYTIANEATTKGTPMIRAMMLEYPNAYTYGANTQYQYMWGPNLLVAPVYQNTAADAKGNDIRNDIYLPDEDQIWIDYFTGKQYRGGGVLNNFDAPIWKLPLFVKNGAIIPMNNENNTPEKIDRSQRKFEVYPSGDTNFEIYEDDGLTTDYKEGKSATTMITSSAPKEGKGKAVIKAGLLTGDYEGIVNDRSTEFIVNVSEKPTDLALKIGNRNVSLKEASSLEEFEKGTNLYFYDKTPNLNKYSTEESEFANVKISTTPKLYIKTEKTNVKENEVELTINDFINTQDISKNEVNTKLSVPTNFIAPEDSITSNSINLTWDKVEGAESYEIEIDGIIQKNITATQYAHKNLDFDTDYSYRIRSVDKDGYSNWSEKLIVKTDLDPYRNVPKDMTVKWTEGNYSSEVPKNAIDGDNNSQFHSAGNAIDKPFIIDMKKAYQIEKLDLLFRNYGNGSVKRAEIYSSLDGVNYEKVFSNASDSGNAAWATDGQVKTINFTSPIKARYFKVVTKESIGNFLAMREFRPYKVDGTSGQLVGDWNNGGTIEEGDLTFLQNYTGLSSVDADWDYVSMADLNFNNVIDAYDISYVASQLEGGIVPTEGGNVAGEIMLVPNKTSISAGETFTVDVVGTGLTDVNAFSAEVPLDSSKYEFIKTEGAVSTASMKNFSKIRVHSDNSQDLYTVFTNIGDNVRLNGTDTLATITLKAKSDINFDLALSDALVVDSNLNSKNAVANITNPEDPLPGDKDSVVKVGKESITVTGDESQLQTGMGLSRLIDGTTSSADTSRMDLKWVYSADQVDKGTLPFEMTFTFNGSKKFDNFTIYNRTGSIAALKKVKAVGYLNGAETDLGEKTNATSAVAKTIYELNGQVFDKIVITALESFKDINTLAINEIEFYEEKLQAPSSIEFLENAPTNLYVNKIAPIFAKVLPETANLNYKLTSENEEVVKVIRVDNDNSATYYLRGVKPGTAKVKATTADGKLSVEHEVTVLDGFDKSILIEAIEKGKSYSKNSEIYTEETYSELLKAIENAEKVLETAKTESELSSAIISIRVAINGLKERDDANLNVIDFSKLEAIFATSEADSDFMENAVDGDENTIWHSGYQSSHKLPVSIVVKLDKPYNLNQIDYLPRQNSKNGHVTEYIVETSLDNENWTEARKGTFKEASNGSGLENRGYNPIRFNTTKAQYVRFTAVKTLGDTRDKYASIAELKFYGQSEVDKSNLSSKISEAEALVEADYTAESFNAVKVAIDAAKGILNYNSATQEQVNEAINILTDAIDNLVKKDDVEEVNKTILAMAIEYVQNLKANGELEGVVPAVIKELEAALKEAKEVLANENATQAQVDIAEKRLINVIHMLEFKVGDKTKLKELVEIIKILDESKYTTSTWNALQVELEKADKVIADENAMEEEVAKTYESLNKAFAELELVADNSKLRELVAELEAKDLSKYTTGTVNEFKAELDYAKGILSNKDASQEEINEAYNKLIKAYLDLRLIPDKSILEDLIMKAEAIDLSKYTKESANKVSLELANVRSVFNNEEASQSEVDEAANGLKLALEGLIASNGNGGNTNNEGNGNNNGNGNGNNNGNNNGNGNGNNNGNGHRNNNNNNSNNGGKLPSTGGTPASAMALLGTLTSLLGVSIMKKRKRNEE